MKELNDSSSLQLREVSMQNLVISSQSEARLSMYETQQKLKKLGQEQQKKQNDIHFYTGLAEGKLQSLMILFNLTIILLTQTLGGVMYNGPNTKAPIILGWICVSHVVFFYFLILVIKFCVIPKKEAKIKDDQSIGFRIYNEVYQGKQKLKDLEFSQLQTILNTMEKKEKEFCQLFPLLTLQRLNNQIGQLFSNKSAIPYKSNAELEKRISLESNEKWWKNFWQGFIVNKSFSIPCVVLLQLAITPLSVASISYSSKQMNNAQAWISLGIWATGIFVFILIKFILPGHIQENVQLVDTKPFRLYNRVHLKQRKLEDYTIEQLQQLQKILTIKNKEFELIFDNQNSQTLLMETRKLLLLRLPHKQEKTEQKIRQMVHRSNKHKKVYSEWEQIFNFRIILTIFNSVTFLIGVSQTLIVNYSKNYQDLVSGQQAICTVGVLFFFLGYTFYGCVKLILLPYLQHNVHKYRDSPYLSYKLVYFGNRALSDLQMHELEDVLELLTERREQFIQIFPKANPSEVEEKCKKIIKQKQQKCPKYEKVYDQLKSYNQSRQNFIFIQHYLDHPLIAKVSSIYMLLALFLFTVATSVIMNDFIGYFGLTVFPVYLLVQIFFHCFYLPKYQQKLNQIKINGFSEYSLVYCKEKKIQDVDLSELNHICRILEENCAEFKKCFPTQNSEKVLKKVKKIIADKTESISLIKSAKDEQKYERICLEINKNKQWLNFWGTLVKQRLYSILSLLIVLNIIETLTIGKSLYGKIVCGFLSISQLALALIGVLIYNFYYKTYMKQKIDEGQSQLCFMERKSKESQIGNNIMKSQVLIEKKFQL